MGNMKNNEQSRILVALGSQILYKSGMGWNGSLYKPGYVGGMVGGNLKAEAVGKLLNTGEIDEAWVTGGTESAYDENGMWITASRARYLRDRIVQNAADVDDVEERVIAIGNIGNTMGNVRDVEAYLTNNEDVLKRVAGTDLDVLSFGVHLERLELFWNANTFLAKNGVGFNPRPLETVLADERGDFFDRLHALERWKQYERMERQGRKHFLNGTYKV